MDRTLRGDLDATSRLMFDLASSADPDWTGSLGPEQLELAHHHGLIGLLATQARHELRAPALPAYTRLQGRQSLMLTHLSRLLERLHDASIPATVLKGPYLALHEYQDSRHRTFTDVDVLVRERDLSKALDVLSSDPSVPSLPRKRPKADKRDIPVKDDSGMWFMLDLHWDLFSYTQLQGFADGATQWAWNVAKPVSDTLFGPHHEIAREAYLAFLCTHALLDHRFRLILFRDLCEVSRNGVDWEAFVRFATDWRLRSFTYLALLIAKEVAGADVGEEVLSELRPRSMTMRAIETMLPRTDLARFDGHRPHPLNLAMVLLHDRRLTRLGLAVKAPAASPHWLKRFGWNRPGNARRMRGGQSPRILIVASSDQRRGAEVFAERLADGFRSRGWAADLVALAGTEESSRVNADVLSDKAPGDLRRLELAATLRLRRKMRVWAPDIVLANGGATLRYVVAAAFGMRGRPLLVYSSIGEPQYWIRNTRHRALQRLLHQRADLVLAVSEATRAQLIEYVGLDPDVVRVAHTGVPRELTELSARSPDGTLRMLFLGNMSHEKDPHRAIWALQELSGEIDARLRFVGGGPLEGQLRELSSAALNGLVEFAGTVDDVGPHLEWADVLILPSVTEGLPGAALEAAAAGVPTVAHRVGGTGEAVVDGETGVLVASEDAHGLVEALRALATDPEKLARLGASARLRAMDRFLMDDTVERYQEMFEGLLSTSRRRNASPGVYRNVS